jgi:hypothetical protein
MDWFLSQISSPFEISIYRWPNSNLSRFFFLQCLNFS